MKLDDLLDCSAAQLEAMSDAELLAHFEPMLKVTRPEFAVKPVAPTHKPIAVVKTKQFASKIEQMKAAGVDLSFLLQATTKRKK